MNNTNDRSVFTIFTPTSLSTGTTIEKHLSKVEGFWIKTRDCKAAPLALNDIDYLCQLNADPIAEQHVISHLVDSASGESAKPSTGLGWRFCKSRVVDHRKISEKQAVHSVPSARPSEYSSQPGTLLLTFPGASLISWYFKEVTQPGGDGSCPSDFWAFVVLWLIQDTGSMDLPWHGMNTLQVSCPDEGE